VHESVVGPFGTFPFVLGMSAKRDGSDVGRLSFRGPLWGHKRKYQHGEQCRCMLMVASNRRVADMLAEHDQIIGELAFRYKAPNAYRALLDLGTQALPTVRLCISDKFRKRKTVPSPLYSSSKPSWRGPTCWRNSKRPEWQSKIW
jgi:hypothetical protein